MNKDKSHWFVNRTMVLATQHRKEEVLAPIMQNGLGVNCVIPDNLDTDQLGTFSGEIERKLSPIEAARVKCRQALQLTGCDLALASEGSFGPHPMMWMIPSDEEFLLLMDLRNNLEITIRHLSTSTNFGSFSPSTQKELLDFAKEKGFPQHGLILSAGEGPEKIIHKGCKDTEELNYHFQSLKKRFGSVTIETDMRAMFNPTRMEVIKETALLLIEKIRVECPECGIPGFAVVEHEPGLPCSSCGFPTRSIKTAIHRCEKCQFEQRKDFPNGKLEEDPMYCDICNP